MTTDTTATLARMDAARIGPHITCPVSRHAAMMAEAMMRGEPYVMMDEDRAHCGASIGDTVASLWEARAEIERLRAALVDLGAAYHACNGEDHPAYIAARAAIVQKEGD